MADMTESLKNTTSPVAISGGRMLAFLKDAAAPPFIKALRSTHEGRRFEEGLSDGVDTLIGFTLGLPQRALRFAHDQITGTRNPTPLAQQFASQEWYVDQLKSARAWENRVTGKIGDAPRPGDNKWRAAGMLTTLVGSLFIPGAQEISAVKIPRILSSIGAQIGTSEVAMDVVDFAENKLDIWAGRSTDAQIAKIGTSVEFEKAATHAAPVTAVKATTIESTPTPHPSLGGPRL